MVIVALDFENYQKVEEFLNLFETPIYVKVGMELFYQEGIEAIKAIKAKGHKVFLDLKFMIFLTLYIMRQNVLLILM